MPTYTYKGGKNLQLGKKLGQGGEGSVYLINGEKDSVAKIFLPQKCKYYEPRLEEMVKNPPEDQTRKLNPPHTSIAWPKQVILENGRFIGYSMPIIKDAPDIFTIYSPLIRKKGNLDFNWFHLHHVASNLACAVNAYHKAGYVIGDLNAKNVKVHQNTLVTMVDTDSIQIRLSNGKISRCPVGTPDFTPPEIQGVKLDQVDRDEYHDAFALSVMIFLLLMEGQHPFTGRPTNLSISVNGPVYQHCISHGIFPYISGKQFIPPKNAPEFGVLHPDVQKLFVRCFENASLKNRLNRPLPLEWVNTLSKVEKDLVKCSSGHFYYSITGKCPWCEREQKLTAMQKNVRQIPVQKPLPRVAPQTPVVKPVQPPPVQKPLNPINQPRRKGTPKWMIWVSIGIVAVASIAIIGAINSKKNQSNASSFLPAAARNGATETTGTNEQVLQEVNSDSPKAIVCTNAPKSNLNLGDIVTVNTSTKLRGHSAPDLLDDDVIARYVFGDQLFIVGGPSCVLSDDSIGYYFWQVQDSAGTISWVAEGDQYMQYLKK